MAHRRRPIDVSIDEILTTSPLMSRGQTISDPSETATLKRDNSERVAVACLFAMTQDKLDGNLVNLSKEFILPDMPSKLGARIEPMDVVDRLIGRQLPVLRAP